MSCKNGRNVLQTPPWFDDDDARQRRLNLGADAGGDRCRRQTESLEALAENQAFQREGVYLTLTSNIALAAIQEASLRGQITATRRLIALQTQLPQILRRQNALGQIALPDVVVQETAVAQARLLLPPLEKQLAQQRNLLAVLTGRFPSDGATATFDLGSLRLPRELPLSLPADLVRQRPHVRAAEASVHAANALADTAGVAVVRQAPGDRRRSDAPGVRIGLVLRCSDHRHRSEPQQGQAAHTGHTTQAMDRPDSRASSAMRQEDLPLVWQL